jgi:hypothetical protein
VRLGETDGVPFGTSACCAANAMYVVFCLHGHVEVDDKVDTLYIDTACGHVGSDKYAVFARLESGKRFFALIKRTVSVELCCRVAHALHVTAQSLCTKLHASKYDSGAMTLAQNLFEQWQFLHFWDDEKFLTHFVGCSAWWCNLYLHRQFHMMRGKLTDFARECRRKETHLALLGGNVDNLFNLWPKTHVEHAVGFVYGEVCESREANSALVEVVNKAAGCCDNDVWSTVQCRNLWTHTGAADEYGGLDTQGATYLFYGFLYLQCEFACRGQNEPTSAVFEYVCHKRHTKGQGLPRTCLGDTYHVFSFEAGRNCLALNRCRRNKPERVETLKY